MMTTPPATPPAMAAVGTDPPPPPEFVPDVLVLVASWLPLDEAVLELPLPLTPEVLVALGFVASSV